MTHATKSTVNGSILSRQARTCFFKIVDQAAVKAAGKQLDWYTKYSAWGIQTGLACCNPNSISWHYISPEKLRSLDSLFYACRTPEMLQHFERETKLEPTVASTESMFRFLGKHTCQQMQDAWKVCTNYGDPNHALAKNNCPVTCSVARGAFMPTRDALRRSFEDKVVKLKMARNQKKTTKRNNNMRQYRTTEF